MFEGPDGVKWEPESLFLLGLMRLRKKKTQWKRDYMLSKVTTGTMICALRHWAIWAGKLGYRTPAPASVPWCLSLSIWKQIDQPNSCFMQNIQADFCLWNPRPIYTIRFVAYNSYSAYGNERWCPIFTRSLTAKFEIWRFLRVFTGSHIPDYESYATNRIV